MGEVYLMLTPTMVPCHAYSHSPYIHTVSSQCMTRYPHRARASSRERTPQIRPVLNDSVQSNNDTNAALIYNSSHMSPA